MAKKSTHTSGTPATVALTAAGVRFTQHTYPHDPSAPSYGLEAAEALGVPPAQVFKTLLVDLEGGPDRTAVGIVPVTQQLDLKAMATACAAKRATMCDPVAAQRITGYVVGGISPVGQKRALPTLLDESAAAQAVVYVSGGRRGFDIGLAPAELLRVTAGRYAAIAR